MTFGDLITDIRLKKGMSLRAMCKKLKIIDMETYSKIERGIQNPYDKDEFNDIIQALGLSDKDEIKELESLAMTFIQEKTMTEKEILEHMPAFPHHFEKDQLDKLKDIIIDINKPSPPKKK